MTLIQVNAFTEELKKIGKSPATVESYSKDVLNFLEWTIRKNLSLAQMNGDDLAHYQNHLLIDECLKPNSARRKVISIRMFFRFLHQKGVVTNIMDESIIPVRIELLPKMLRPIQLTQILEVCEKTPHHLKKYRDLTIVALLAYEGLKSSEIVDLKWTDLLLSASSSTLRIIGVRHRIIQLQSTTIAYLQSYKAVFEKAAQLDLIKQTTTSPRMMVSFKGKDNQFVLPKLTRHGLKFCLYEIGERISVAKLNAELLRHYAIDHLRDLGLSPGQIMEHFGVKRLGNIQKHFA